MNHNGRGRIWPRKVLLPVDFSACSEAVLDQAIELIGRHEARVFLLHVTSASPGWSTRLIPELDLLDARRQLRLLREEGCRHHPGSHASIETLLRQGAVVTEVLQAARQIQADLIVIPTHDRHGLSRLVYGSVAKGVMGPAPCPVMVIHPEAEGRPRPFSWASVPMRILAPVDSSFPPTLPMFERALALTGRHPEEILLLHVIESQPLDPQLPFWTPFSESETRRTLESLVSQVRSAVPADVKVRTLLKFGDASDQIVQAARREAARLIVMGTHSRKGLEHFVAGSVTEAVLKSTPCPLLVFHPALEPSLAPP